MQRLTELQSADQRILSLLIQQNERGMAMLYEQYARILFNVIYRIVKQEAMAQDVFQEVMVRVWHKIHQFDPERGSLFTWLVSVARNAAIDKTRSREFRSYQRKAPIEGRPAAESQSGADHESAQLRDVLRTLPDHQKVLIEMAYFQGYTHEEIAARLQMPLGTVKTRIRTALKYLRGLL
ncbi:MAG: sigma-70 family RNA polymerase sigma factor [Bacteroidia bacterium]|nr:sigma-70 family RNA polymerase sigma factor [Bacteroidia bacterium]